MPAKTKKIPFAKIKGLRAERGLSMAQIAKIVGISKCAYAMKENGLTDFRSSEMEKMIKLFGVSGDELFFSKVISNVTRNRNEVLRT